MTDDDEKWDSKRHGFYVKTLLIMDTNVKFYL
jgi:hypothetical protein